MIQRKKSSVEYLDTNVIPLQIFFYELKANVLKKKFRYVLNIIQNYCEIYTLYSNEKIKSRLIAGKKSTKKMFQKNYTIEW